MNNSPYPDSCKKDLLLPDKQCQCNLCVYSRKVDNVIEKRDVDELITIVNELMDSVCNMGEDLEYSKCVLDGSWPSSVRILEAALEKAKVHPNRDLQ